jgi:hypothetical protein
LVFVIPILLIIGVIFIGATLLIEMPFPSYNLFVFKTPHFSVTEITQFWAIYQIHVTSGYVTNLGNKDAKKLP